MATADDLERTLARLDGRGYPGYREIRGAWEMDGFRLAIDHVQGDPFAGPSRVSAHLPAETAALDRRVLGNGARRVGVAAWLAGAFSEAAAKSGGAGSGGSGAVRMASPGQLVLPQTAVQLHSDGSVEARFTVGLPARGRRILGREAVDLLIRRVPGLVFGTLPAAAHPPEALLRAAEVNEDAEALREQLPAHGLVAFVADGSVLPRRSGVDDRPLEEDAVPFRSPPSLRVVLETPNGGPVQGMGIREGVTLVVGGGFHGKSTLLRALEAGIWNHRPGDGRERVVTVDRAVKIRAEDGRSVTGVDISPFIDGLPGGQDTRRFTTRNASGSTSQASALAEALELDATALLMDEDTCATNFLIRDRRMQALVPAAKEPITPLVDRIRDLHGILGVSTVLVLGGSGDYLDVADTVVGMEDFHPRDLTARAAEVASAHPTGRQPGGRSLPGSVANPRTLSAGALPRGRRDRDLRVRALDERTLRAGDERLDLAAVEQLLLPTQLRTVAAALETMAHRDDWAGRPLREVVEGLAGELREALDAVDARRPGDLALVRSFEVAAALNRLRTLQVES